MRASTSINTRMTFTLASWFIAEPIDRTTDVTTAVLATKQIATEEIEWTVLTFITASAFNRWFTRTLTSLWVACIQSTNSPVDKTITFCRKQNKLINYEKRNVRSRPTFATFRIANIQIPIQRFAFVANTSSDTLLTLAKFTNWQWSASREGSGDASRITITFLASWVIVKAFFAVFACFAIEVIWAKALSLRITRNAIRAGELTVTR